MVRLVKYMVLGFLFLLSFKVQKVYSLVMEQLEKPSELPCQGFLFDGRIVLGSGYSTSYLLNKADTNFDYSKSIQNREVDFDNYKIDTEELVDEKGSVLLKITTITKRVSIERAIQLIRLRSDENNIQYFIDSLPTKHLMIKNHLRLDSLAFNTSSRGMRICGTGVNNILVEGYPERRLTKLDATNGALLFEGLFEEQYSIYGR